MDRISHDHFIQYTCKFPEHMPYFSLDADELGRQVELLLGFLQFFFFFGGTGQEMNILGSCPGHSWTNFSLCAQC